MYSVQWNTCTSKLTLVCKCRDSSCLAILLVQSLSKCCQFLVYSLDVLFTFWLACLKKQCYYHLKQIFQTYLRHDKKKSWLRLDPINLHTTRSINCYYCKPFLFILLIFVSKQHTCIYTLLACAANEFQKIFFPSRDTISCQQGEMLLAEYGPYFRFIGTNVREGKRGKSINFHRDSKHAMAHANFPAGINYSQIFTSYNNEYLNVESIHTVIKRG